MKYGFGIDIGGTTVKMAWFSQDGNLLEKWEIPTVRENNGSRILPDIAAAVRQFQEKNGVKLGDVMGIGVGVPGPVDGCGVVNKCINLGWGVFNIEQELSKLTGLPVKAGNDANLAALGEAWKGGGKGSSNTVFVTLGTGVGGGIIVNGRPISGVHGAAGEIGHIVVNTQETEACSCGKFGCAEQYCSATGVVRVTKRHLRSDGQYSVLRAVEPLTCRDVFDAAREGDALAQQALEEVYDYMGQFLANVCMVSDPETVVIGGGVSRAGQMLLDGARRHFDKYIFHASRAIRFALATLGNDAGVYGAFKLMQDAGAAD